MFKLKQFFSFLYYRMDSILYYIYTHTDDKRPTMKIYNIINVASVLHGIRKGCIIAGILNENVNDLLNKLSTYKLYSSLYPLQMQKETSTIIISKAPLKRESNLDTNVGRALGYFNPSVITNFAKYHNRLYIYVEVQKPDGEIISVNFFPQKIKVPKKEYEDILNKMAEQLLDMPLIEGFKIIKAEPVVE